MQSIAIDRITVNREGRQRSELKGLEELAESIKRNAASLVDTGGLIHPIVVTRDLVLVAGERRLSACRDFLGYTHISANFVDELDQSTLTVIELEENIKRLDISWQDRCKAMEAYHEARKAQDPGWSQSKTAEAIGVDQRSVSENIAVAKNLNNPRVAQAPKFSVARGIVARTESRKDAVVVERLRDAIAAPVADHAIIQADFTTWAPAYDGPKFNLIHCDFPYGIGADGFNQGSAPAHGGYDDSEANYWTLCQTLADNLDRIAGPSCHLVFWFSMRFYQATLDFIREETDFVIDPFPLVWMKSDGAGILPDPQRGPRRIYETAFFGHRGDRKIVGAVANAYAAPSVRERHMSEKPEPMLRHFFRMLVDEHSLVLDPTAGSGSSIRAARSLKAKHALGLELNPEFAKIAQQTLKGTGDAN